MISSDTVGSHPP